MNPKLAIALIVVTLSLAACGNKGPLVLAQPAAPVEAAATPAGEVPVEAAPEPAPVDVAPVPTPDPTGLVPAEPDPADPDPTGSGDDDGNG